MSIFKGWSCCVAQRHVSGKLHLDVLVDCSTAHHTIRREKLDDVRRSVAVWGDFAWCSVGEIIPFLSSPWGIFFYATYRLGKQNWIILAMEICFTWKIAQGGHFVAACDRQMWFFALQLQTGTSTYCNVFVDFMWGDSKCRYMLPFAQAGAVAWDLRRS